MSPKWIRLTAECLGWLPEFWRGIIPTTTYNHQHMNIINHTTIVLNNLQVLFSLSVHTTQVIQKLFYLQNPVVLKGDRTQTRKDTEHKKVVRN